MIIDLRDMLVVLRCSYASAIQCHNAYNAWWL